jgi:aminoglycoside phosphotransferase (APT) family kinase protein
MRPWNAEVVVDVDLARRLIGQFGELTVTSMRKFAEGWDRAMWLVDERWVFGFPRRAVAVPGIEREMALLPRLAPLLPLAIPRPVFFGRPAHGYPWPFFGSAFVPGHDVGDATLAASDRIPVALELCAFLRRLHSAAVADALGGALPIDPNGRTDTRRRVRLTRQQLSVLAHGGLWRAPAVVARVLAQGERLAPSKHPPVIAHGDLHFRHLLVADRRASGVIDWGDVCRADPAIDLQFLWSLAPPAARGALLDAYGPVTEEQLLRARVLALSLCAALAHYGHELGAKTIAAEAIAGLDRAATD